RALLTEVAHRAGQALVVAEILRRPPAREDEPGALLGADVAEGDVGREPVAGRLDRDVPVGVRVVHHQVIGPLRRRRDEDLVAVLADAVQRVKRVEDLGGVADDEQDLDHGAASGAMAVSCGRRYYTTPRLRESLDDLASCRASVFGSEQGRLRPWWPESGAAPPQRTPRHERDGNRDLADAGAVEGTEPGRPGVRPAVAGRRERRSPR